MNAKKSLFVSGTGLWTAVTLAGSIYMVFNNPITEAITAQPQHPSVPVKVLLFIALAIGIAAIAGGLWGGGIAYLIKHDLKLPVKTGALMWVSTVTLAGIVLYFSQIPGAAFDRATDFSIHDVHYFFTVAFALTVGVAAMVNNRKMAAALGFDDLKNEIGRTSGAAAAGAFIVVSLGLLFGLGWEVGRPGFFAGYRYRYSMLVIMYWCNFGAALAGGLPLGWSLVQQQATDPS